MFASPTKAKLQEIGPKFTLKLRWLRKGLPSVLAADGVAPHAKNADKASDEEDVEGEEEEGKDVAMDEAEEKVEDDEEEAPGKKKEKNVVNGVKIPALDEEQEYEWKWKVCGMCGRRVSAADALVYSPRWTSIGDSSTCDRPV
jgi:ribosome production factor 1